MSRHHHSCWTRQARCVACGGRQALQVEAASASPSRDEEPSRAARQPARVESSTIEPSGDGAGSPFQAPLLRPSVALVLAFNLLNLFAHWSSIVREQLFWGPLAWLGTLLYFSAKGALIVSSVRSRGPSRTLGLLALGLAFTPSITASLLYSPSWSFLWSLVFNLTPPGIHRMFDASIIQLTVQGCAALGLILVLLRLGSRATAANTEARGAMNKDLDHGR